MLIRGKSTIPRGEFDWKAVHAVKESFGWQNGDLVNTCAIHTMKQISGRTVNKDFVKGARKVTLLGVCDVNLSTFGTGLCYDRTVTTVGTWSLRPLYVNSFRQK